MNLIILTIIIMAVTHVKNVNANCEYQCDHHPEGPCKLKIVAMPNPAIGLHGSLYIPKCKPCAEVCRPENGFAGGMNWNA